jgi:hypothetical protein
LFLFNDKMLMIHWNQHPLPPCTFVMKEFTSMSDARLFFSPEQQQGNCAHQWLLLAWL